MPKTSQSLHISPKERILLLPDRWWRNRLIFPGHGIFLWCFKENRDHCGGGGVLFFSHSHYFNLKWGLGQGTNNVAELLALKFLLSFACEKEISNLQIFGDSMLFINWLRRTQQYHNIIFSPILYEVFTTTNLFTNMSFNQ